MARKSKTLGEKLVMSALSAFGDHLWEQNPEVRQLVNAFGFTQATSRKRPDPEDAVEEKKPRKPRRRWTAPTPREESSGEEIVIELEKKSDGSFGPK